MHVHVTWHEPGQIQKLTVCISVLVLVKILFVVTDTCSKSIVCQSLTRRRGALHSYEELECFSCSWALFIVPKEHQGGCSLPSVVCLLIWKCHYTYQMFVNKIKINNVMLRWSISGTLQWVFHFTMFLNEAAAASWINKCGFEIRTDTVGLSVCFHNFCINTSSQNKTIKVT